MLRVRNLNEYMISVSNFSTRRPGRDFRNRYYTVFRNRTPRLTNEIEPIKAEHSAATYKNDNKWGARLAIDQDSAKGGSSGLPPVTDCKYGDTVQLTNLESDWLAMYEIVIIERGTKSAFDFRNCISFDVIPCK